MYTADWAHDSHWRREAYAHDPDRVRQHCVDELKVLHDLFDKSLAGMHAVSVAMHKARSDS